jgi:hypothetical protein
MARRKPLKWGRRQVLRCDDESQIRWPNLTPCLPPQREVEEIIEMAETGSNYWEPSPPAQA